MTTFMQVAIAGVALFVLGGPPALGAEIPASERTYENFWKKKDVKWSEARLGHLLRFVGTHNYEAVLDDPVLGPDLKTAFGPHLPHFLKNVVGDRSEIDFAGWGIVVRGYGEVPARERAILFVDLVGFRLYGAIFSEGVTTVFADGKEYGDLPPVVLEWGRGGEVSRLIHKEPETNFRLVNERYQ